MEPKIYGYTIIHADGARDTLVETMAGCEGRARPRMTHIATQQGSLRAGDRMDFYAEMEESCSGMDIHTAIEDFQAWLCGTFEDRRMEMFCIAVRRYWFAKLGLIGQVSGDMCGDYSALMDECEDLIDAMAGELKTTGRQL
jgi:hypothetical protein